MDKRELGKWGEELAVAHLTGKGYAIVETNWRIDHFEIDIVAMHAGRLVFVEVKTRKGLDSDPIEAITRKKQANMVASANAYVQLKKLPHELQFDVISIRGDEQKHELEHYPDAFEPALRSY